MRLRAFDKEISGNFFTCSRVSNHLSSRALIALLVCRRCFTHWASLSLVKCAKSFAKSLVHISRQVMHAIVICECFEFSCTWIRLVSSLVNVEVLGFFAFADLADVLSLRHLINLVVLVNLDELTKAVAIPVTIYVSGSVWPGIWTIILSSLVLHT